jgi:hypothetical protein
MFENFPLRLFIAATASGIRELAGVSGGAEYCNELAYRDKTIF